MKKIYSIKYNKIFKNKNYIVLGGFFNDRNIILLHLLIRLNSLNDFNIINNFLKNAFYIILLFLLQKYYLLN